MVQLNCLSLWNEDVADRILNQDILHRPSRNGSALLFDPLFAFTCK